MIDKNRLSHNWKRESINVIVLTLVLGSIFILGQFVGAKNPWFDWLKPESKAMAAAKQESQNSFDEKLFWEVWRKVTSTYVDKDKLKDIDLFHGALKGLVSATGDPYSVYMTPKEKEDFATDMSGKFEGIGAEIGLRDGIITVVSPLEGMPASKAGILSGDQIIKINNESTAGFSVMEAVSKIRGKRGTKVELMIFRKNQPKPLEFSIVREVIVVKSVKTEMTKSGVYVIKVSSFGDDTANLFNQAVSDILIKKPKGVVLDLRNNPGGYLETAVEMVGAWVKNDLAVSENYGDGNVIKHITKGQSALSGFKTVVLVNEGSASASEIVAGALQDYKLAKVVGEKTFGKGSVQVLEELSDGGSIKITAAKWFTPQGKTIEGQGITPDMEIINDPEGKDDKQKNKAIEIITQKHE